MLLQYDIPVVKGPMHLPLPLRFSLMAMPLCALLAGAQTPDVVPGATVAVTFAADADTGPVKAPAKPILFDPSAIDKHVDPCVDFYQYACGNWRRDNPIPPDQTTWGRFNQLSERNQYLLYTDLERAANDPKTPLQHKYGDFYAACMDTAVADEKGTTPLKPQLDAIAALGSTKDLAALNVAYTERFGGPVLLGLGVDQDQKDSSRQILETGQGGLSLPDRDYYLNPAPRFAKLRDGYLENLKTTFALLGDTPAQAATEAGAVMRIETALAQGSMDRVALREPSNRYHILTVAQAQALTPSFHWQSYLDGIGLGAAPSLNVEVPEFDRTVEKELETETLDAWKSYLRWHTVHSAAPLLSQPFVQANFDFFSKTLNGQQELPPRWKRCTRLTDAALGEAVGQDWVRENFPPEAKANMEKLVKALETALGQDIQQLPWMSEGTKQQAELKLAAFRQKIGYPTHWRDYSSLIVRRDDLLGNAQRSSVFELRHELSKYGKPVDETEWDMTPPTVNAYYNPSRNEIVFPAGILQPPFFSAKADDAVNYGGFAGVGAGDEQVLDAGGAGRNGDGQHALHRP